MLVGPTLAPPILVSGHINIETTLRVAGFPLAYNPVNYPFFGIRSSVSGVGFNLAKALTTLGEEVRLLSLVGRDLAAEQARAALVALPLSDEWVEGRVAATAQSVILYDEAGQRQIHADLKDIQDQRYPAERFEAALMGCGLCVLGNINYSRPFLAQARQAGIPIATDVHALAELEDEYNRDFMAAATILFMSDERLTMPPVAWARTLLGRYPPEILVIGLGERGALLAVRRDDFIGRLPAVRTRPVVNTIGAGDALLAAFLHRYHRSGDPYDALRHAVLFASYKVGAVGAAEGFADSEQLARLYRERGEQHFIEVERLSGG